MVVIESSLITSKPNGVDKINQIRSDSDFALRGPSSITNLPNIIHRRKLQSHVKATSKPAPNVYSKRTFKEDMKRGFNMLRAKITHRRSGASSEHKIFITWELFMH
jgi:hypothetical protein